MATIAPRRTAKQRAVRSPLARPVQPVTGPQHRPAISRPDPPRVRCQDRAFLLDEDHAEIARFRGEAELRQLPRNRKNQSARPRPKRAKTPKREWKKCRAATGKRANDCICRRTRRNSRSRLPDTDYGLWAIILPYSEQSRRAARSFREGAAHCAGHTEPLAKPQPPIPATGQCS